MFDRDLFGEALIRLRGDRAQRQVAKEAGIPPGSLCQWERGLRSPRKGQIQKLLDGLGRTEDDLRLMMWTIQAERLALKGSACTEDHLRRSPAHQELVESSLLRISGNARELMTRLRDKVCEARNQVSAVQADLEAVIVFLGRMYGKS